MPRFLTVSIWILLGIAPSHAQSDRYRGAYSEMFFGRQPSARSEAMARSQVAVGGEVYSAYYNPAALASLPSPVAGATFASPFYLTGDAHYDYYGVAVPLGRFGTLGVSRFFFNRSPETITLTDGVRELRNETALYALSYGLSIGRWADVGVNVNLFRRLVSTDDFEWDMRGYPVDLGLFKAVSLGGEAALRWGASLSNINGVKVGLENQKDALPTVLRAGMSYSRVLRESEETDVTPLMNLLVTAEYQDLLNGEERRAWRLGVEALLWEVLALRVGYYHESVDDYGIAQNADALSEFTYGAGFCIPVKGLFAELPNWVVRLDYAHLPQPDYTRDAYNWPRFTTVGASLEIR